MNRLWWIIFALTGIIILLILFQPTPEPVNNAIWQTEIWRVKTKAEKLKAKHEKDSAAHVKELAQARDSLKSEQKHGVKLQSNLVALKSKPQVVKIVQENPVIDTVFQHYDSLLESKDNQLAIQTEMISSLEAENVRITDNFLARLELSQQAFDNQKLISDSYKKDTRKVRRQVKLLKVVAVIGTVGGVFLGAQF